MFDRSGHRRQEFMRENPANDPVRNNDRLYKGVVNAVFTKDFQSNGITCQQTLVDMQLVGVRLPALNKVPLATSKANILNGTSWTPEIGDMVIVQFINGNTYDPVVTGYLYPVDVDGQGLTPATADIADGSHYFLRCNETTEEIRKDGTRTVHVAKDEILDIVGDGTVTIGGTLTIVVTGNADITAPKITLHASEKVEMETPLLHVTGNIKSDGDITDSVRSMAADRAKYNVHGHPSGPPPNPQE